MARILFAWELGGGIGYVDRLSQVATALAAEGHEPVFVVRDLIGTADFFARKPWIVMQAPMAVGRLFAVSWYAGTRFLLATGGSKGQVRL